MSTVVAARQHWIRLAQGMQQDLKAYEALRELLKAQFHAALSHDTAAMEQLAQRISAQAQQLAQSTQERSEHVSALLPAGTPPSMRAAFALLKAPLQQQMQGLWTQLEALVQECKAMNLRNCELIMEQAQLMQQVIGGSSAVEGVYGPR